jgi:hypothetical protein
MTRENESDAQIQVPEGALAEMVTRAEYDVQIATARRYPRSIKQFINDATELVTLNEQVADDCIYALPRDGKTIEGPSARFAEIILHAWGHTRAGARVVNEDGRFITAQGVCHDLQSNTLIAYEVRRRITKSSGQKYNDDMVGVTGNAASSIALRNAITKVIPKALWEPIYQQARKVVMGNATTLANRRATALTHMQKFGATEEMVLRKLGVKGVEDITLDHLVTLRGFATALKEGDSTVEQLFAEDKPEAASKTDAIKQKLREQHQGQRMAPENDLALQDWIDDIASAPTVEGVDFKFEQGANHFRDKPDQFAQLLNARDQRKAALAQQAKPKTAETAVAEQNRQAAASTADTHATKVPNAAHVIPAQHTSPVAEINSNPPRGLFGKPVGSHKATEENV